MKLFSRYFFLFLICVVAFHISYGQETKAKLIDTFSWVGADDASARLELWRNEYEKVSNSKGYVIIYGGENNKRGEIDAHIRGIKSGLSFINFDHTKFLFIKGGFRKKLEIDFWVVPQGSCPPLLTPTVDFEKVRFRGVSRKVIPYWCC